MAFGNLRRSWLALFVIVLASITPLAVSAQDDNAPPPAFDFSGQLGEGGLGLPRVPGSDDSEGSNVAFTAKYQYDQAAKKAKLSVTARIQPGWHVYAITQGKKNGSGPQATRIAVKSDALADPSIGDAKNTAKFFKSDRDPSVHFEQGIPEWSGLEIQEHAGQVTWTALVDLASGVDPEKATFEITVRGQVCKTDGLCIPFKEVLNAKFDGYVEPPKQAGRFESSNVTIEGFAQPAAAAPGQDITLTFKATPNAGWHMYAREDKDPGHADGRGKPTLIVLSKLDGLLLKDIVASSEPTVKPADGVVGEQRFHEGPVTWTVTLTVPNDLPAGAKTLGGYIAYQLCDKDSCIAPRAAKFEVPLADGDAPPDSQQPFHFSPAGYKEASAAAATVTYQKAAGPMTAQKLLVMLGLGLLGGLILNLMPCVLPVIGLKVLSFAEQGGKHRSHVFALNLAYSVGLILVFIVLATFASFLNLSWGQQFTYTWFKVAMVGLVFAMALSFLGVWEIPIPGFVGAGKSNELQAKEGLSGAFFKGVFTTILATPCSGPFLGPVFGFTLGQSWYVTYLIFGSVGVGMALPYLLIGLQPSLVRWLPKPGEWMDTFKQFMGFVLLGTVVYLFTTINKDYFIPTLTMMVGIWFGCWMIGRVPAWAELFYKAKAWGLGVTSSAVITAGAFLFLAPWPHLYEWHPYSADALAKAQAEGKTVMVDFTANWCQTCQYNFLTAINTNGVKEVIEKNNVVPLLADWTEPSDEIEKKLADLQAASIPLLAIYPANRPGEVIVLRDVVSQSQLIEALEKAGPSQAASAARSEILLGNTAQAGP
jgi:thiol:disulfide interchange protein